jgi:hypothetical protein
MSSPIASTTAILRSTLRWGVLIEGAIAVVGALVGWLVAGPSGLGSALIGVGLAAVFLALTAITMLIGARASGGSMLSTAYFAIVLGGWFVKIVVFFVVLLVLRGQPWISPLVFFFAVVTAVLASLVVDIVVFSRARVPYVGDVELPSADERENRGNGS